MNTKYLFSLVIFLVSVTNGYAEFICSSHVGYKWKSGEQEQEVNVIAVSESGVDETAAKSALVVKVNSEKTKAYADCAKSHENVSGCTAAKLAAQMQIYQNLTFSGRKSLEESIKEDCTKSQGKCLGATASDPVCVEKKSETATDAAAAGTEAAAKGAPPAKGEKKK